MATGGTADEHRDQIGEPEFVGQGVEQGHHGPHDDGAVAGRPAQVEEDIDQAGQNKGDFFGERLHMELPAVIFPDTVMAEGMLVPLVPVFAPLVYLQPVENDPALDQMQSGLCAELLRAGLCQTQAPAPLGEDRERFLRLVSDIRNRRDGYAAQLGHQTLAGISTASSKRSETKSSIVGSLLAGHGIREEGDDRRRLLLWQARLMLKLAEMHGADQEELRRQMQRIRQKEEGLFTGMREEGENPFALSGELAALVADPVALRQQRRAWSRLLVLGDTPDFTPRIILSGDRDGVDLLAEAYEKGTGMLPQRLGQLALPASSPEPEKYVEQVRRFREEGSALLARVQEWLGSQIGPDAAACFSPAEEEAWTTLLARFFPAAQCGRALLTLLACPGRSVRWLAVEAFAPEDREFLSGPESDAGHGFVLGILEEAALNVQER